MKTYNPGALLKAAHELAACSHVTVSTRAEYDWPNNFSGSGEVKAGDPIVVISFLVVKWRYADSSVPLVFMLAPHAVGWNLAYPSNFREMSHEPR